MAVNHIDTDTTRSIYYEISSGLFLLFTGILVPLACGNSNNVPTAISSGPTRTFTPTASGTVLTNTPTATTAGAFTATPTFTNVIAPPSYRHNYGVAGPPNGITYSSGTLYVSNSKFTTIGGAAELNNFTVSGSSLSGPGYQGLVGQGIPTPWVGTATPWAAAATIGFSNLQSYVVGSTYSAALDSSNSPSGTSGTLFTSGYSGITNGTIYTCPFSCLVLRLVMETWPSIVLKG